MINNNAIIYQYLRFALDINNNISSTIQLLNNLRFNVSTIIEQQQQQQQQAAGSIPRRPLNIPIIEMSRNLSARNLSTHLYGDNTNARTSSLRQNSVRRPRRQRASATQTSRSRNATTFRRTFSNLQAATPHAINNATSCLLYSDLSTNFLICPIQQTSFNATDNVMKINHCGHIFLESALREWFRTSSECPVCRYNINPPPPPVTLPPPPPPPPAPEAPQALPPHLHQSTLESATSTFGELFPPLDNTTIDPSGNSLLYLEYSFPFTWS